MIDDWKLTPTDGSLYLFVGLVSFYHRYATYLEMRLKLLQLLIKNYFRTTIPTMAWTPYLIKLFEDVKICLTSSLVLAQYKPNKTIFLKTDWSVEGMSWIMMQPTDDKKSIAATILLLETGECKLDLARDVACLRPTGFGYRVCLLQESNYHSFVGEAACGKWAID